MYYKIQMTDIYKIAGIVITAVCLTGCSAINSPSSKIVGKWKFRNSAHYGPHTITFTRDNKFKLDYDDDGKKDIWGRYEIFLDQYLKFTDAKDEMFTLCRHSGFHSFDVKKKELHLRSYADACSPRVQTLAIDWVKINNAE